MREDILTKLKAEREALDHQIASHRPLAHNVALDKVRAYVTDHVMTEDDLFPGRYDPDEGPVPGPIRDFRRTPFSDFRYEDTFGYTFIGDLKQGVDEMNDVGVACYRGVEGACHGDETFTRRFCPVSPSWRQAAGPEA